MQNVAIKRLLSNPVGRLAFRLIRPFIHMQRRMANPGVPLNHAIANVEYRGKGFSLRHRRHSLNDIQAIKQCFAESQYDMPGGPHGAFINRRYEEIVKSGKKPLLVDCGANIGASVAWFSARFPQAHIIAIEPAADNFSFLEINSKGIDVELWEAGISGEDGHSWLSARLNWGNGIPSARFG